MPLSSRSACCSTTELTELSAILRAIALNRKNAAPALRDMAAQYEIRATSCQMSLPWVQGD